MIRHVRNISSDKVATSEELIAIVNEQWKGVNGRGGYRIERERYPQYRIPAKKWKFQALIVEKDENGTNFYTHLI